MPRRRGILAVAIVFAGLAAAAPATAVATDRWVDDSGSDTANDCADQVNPCKTIGAAVTAADSGDVVHIGAGLYGETVDASTKSLDFVGAGPGPTPPTSPVGATDTVITGTPGTDGALIMRKGGSATGLRVVGNTSSGTASNGIFIGNTDGLAHAYSLQNVIAIGGVDTGALTLPALRVVDESSASQPITVNITGGYFTNGLATTVVLTNAGAATDAHDVDVTFTSSTIEVGSDSSFGKGLSVVNGAHTTLDRVTIGPDDTRGGRAMEVKEGGGGFGSSATIIGSVLRAKGDTLAVSSSGGATAGTASADVRDSFLTSGGTTSTSVSAFSGASSDARLDLTGSTILVRHPSAFSALDILASASGATATANVTNSILRSVDSDLSNGTQSADLKLGQNNGGTALANVSHSSFSTAESYLDPQPLPSPAAGGNVAGDPRFVNEATKDVHLASDSPLIDRGDAGAITGGELDLAGSPRSVDGDRDCTVAPDVGAFEFLAAPASCPPPGDGNPPGDTTPPGGTTPPPNLGPFPDTQPPAVGLTLGKRPRLGRALRRGLKLQVSCSEACALQAKGRIARSIAKRLGLAAAAVTVARGSGSTPGAATVTVRLKFTKKARRRLARARRVPLSIAITAKDAAGNAGSDSLKTTLKR